MTRSRPIEFDAFNFPSLNQRCAKGMRGVIRVDSGGRRGVKEETRKRTSVAIGNRTGSKGEIRSKSLISRHIRGISKFPQEWTLGEI